MRLLLQNPDWAIGRGEALKVANSWLPQVVFQGISGMYDRAEPKVAVLVEFQ